MGTACNTAGNILMFAAMVLVATDAAAQAPVQSFADLQPLLKPGQQVTVWNTDGRKVSGRVVAVSGDTLEIGRGSRWFFRRPDRRQVFTEASVSRVDARDSTTVYGGLLGFAIGVAVVVTAAGRPATCGDLCELSVVAPIVGPFIGAAIDGAINRSLYTSPAATTRISVAPLFLYTRGAGISASISF